MDRRCVNGLSDKLMLGSPVADDYLVRAGSAAASSSGVANHDAQDIQVAAGSSGVANPDVQDTHVAARASGVALSEATSWCMPSLLDSSDMEHIAYGGW